MAQSWNRRVRELRQRREELIQRAAWARGEERESLLREAKELAGQISAGRGRRR